MAQAGQHKGSTSAQRSFSPTVEDVARVAGVSVMTVWRSLSGNTRVRPTAQEAITRAVTLLGYSSSRLPGALRPMRIGILGAGESGALLNELLVRSLDDLAARSVQLVVHQYEPGQHAAVTAQRIAESRMDGIILLSTAAGAEHLLEMLEQENIPAVVLADGPVAGIASFVDIDDATAAHEMTSHLLDLGHRRIAFIKGAPGWASGKRYEGYCTALRQREIEVEEQLVYCGSSTYQSGLDAGEQLLEAAVCPTAIFASNDEMAAAVIAAANRRGLSVPGDLTVCGFGDSAFAEVIWPSLTTIRRPVSQMARAATDLIGAAITARRQGRSLPAERVLLPHMLIRRQSDAAPRRRPRLNVKA